MSETLLNNICSRIKKDFKVMFMWQGANIPANFEQTIKRMQVLCGADSKINVEHNDRLQIVSHEKSTFDLILSNVLTPSMESYKSLSNLLSLLKPNGQFIEIGQKSSTLESELKLNGFKNVSIENFDDLVLFYAEKPNFEVGAASKLKFKSKPTAEANGEKKVWKFSANDINEDDLIDTDDLLDETDLKKPEVQVRDCGTSKEGKKKACKDCSCGLAEEIEAEATGQIKKNQAPAGKSACGSCYLGDAFRCASCPYLGMPAFKAGEKVQLGNSLLKADI